MIFIAICISNVLHFLWFLYEIGGVMDRIIIMDFENGSEVYIPISEFLKQGFIDALVFQ